MHIPVHVYIQIYWYETLLIVPAIWFGTLFSIIKLKHARDNEVLYSDSMMPNKFSVINIFKDNYTFITKRKDICWFYACFLLKTNLFLIKLFNIL